MPDVSFSLFIDGNDEMRQSLLLDGRSEGLEVPRIKDGSCSERFMLGCPDDNKDEVEMFDNNCVVFNKEFNDAVLLFKCSSDSVEVLSPRIFCSFLLLFEDSFLINDFSDGSDENSPQFSAFFESDLTNVVFDMRLFKMLLRFRPLMSILMVVLPFI